MSLGRLSPLLRCHARRALSSASMGEPVLDWDFLLDPANTERLRTNARQRGSPGDIDLVLDFHRRYSASKDEATRAQLMDAALRLPNFSHPDSPVGDESRARLLQEQPGPTPAGALSAEEVGRRLALLRISHLGLSAGPRVYLLLGGLALLERALVRLALHRLAGFRRVAVPDVLPVDLVERCGFPTRGLRTQVFHLEDADDLCLAGTAEMSLAGCFAGQQLDAAGLPLRLCAASRCFRREVPRQEAALYRVPQFTKVEMFGICAPADSAALLQQFVDIQVRLLTDLQLGFRVLEMPTEELGASAHRKIDIEAWMPGSASYGEVSSASDCTDYQARRLLIRIGPTGEFAATVNATAVAVPRMVKALVETHQGDDGRVRLPEALWPWMGGVRELRRLHPPAKMTFVPRLKTQDSK